MMKKHPCRVVLFFLALLLAACQPSMAQSGIASPTQAIRNTQSTSASMETPVISTTSENQPTEGIENTQSPSASVETPNSTTTTVSQPTPTKIINPLTGLAVDDPNLLNRRPVFIVVSNFPRAGRPHAGLSFADIVFDYYIGAGTDRFLAVYYGQDATNVGPVRSGRFVDTQLVSLFQGILGFGSADEDTLAKIYGDLGKRAISNPEAACPVFCGTDTHSVTGVFANSAELSQWYGQKTGDNQRYDLGGMFFDNQVPFSGEPADQISILYNYYDRSDWKFDALTAKYARWNESVYAEIDYQMVPTTDRITGQYLEFSNLIILFANNIEISPTRYQIDIQGNIDGERAILFRDGKMFEGKWITPSLSRPIQFLNPDGTPLALKPGNTWIAIVGLASSFKEITAGQWEAYFNLP